MDMRIVFPGGMRVNAEIEDRVIATDQPARDGGEHAAPTPFDHFVASIGTCVGFYALKFFRRRSLSTDGLELTLSTVADPQRHMISEVIIKLELPADFPERYRTAVARAVDQCTVKKHLAQPPRITTIVEPDHRTVPEIVS
jgi:ribosomal protein S12 methylthiotransferase accessory factor